MRFCIFILFFTLFISISLGQDLVSGLLPNVTLSYKISENYKIIHKLESRFPTFIDDFEDPEVDFERFDFQNFVERKIGLYSKLSVGYQLRILPSNRYSHRSIQQFSWSERFNKYRFSHRVRSDQTFSEFRKPEVRFRYRLALQIPLQGDQLDEGEYYFSVSDELVWSYRSPDADLENRIVSKIGLYLNDKSKIETGIEWRAEQFFLENIRHQLWFCVSWYKSL